MYVYFPHNPKGHNKDNYGAITKKIMIKISVTNHVLNYWNN